MKMAKDGHMARSPVEVIEQKLLTAPKRTIIEPARFLSSGSTLLNMAISKLPNCGFPMGSHIFLVGDSFSGKTWWSLTCLAEAIINPHFKKHRFIHDNPEGGQFLDQAAYFGPTFTERIEEPEHGTSDLLETFYYNVDSALKDKTPFIYVLDSMDVLTTAEDEELFDSNKTAHLKGKEGEKSYGTSKARKNSDYLKIIRAKLAKSDSILIVISQTRQNIGTKALYKPKTRGGGDALRYYADVEIWTSIKKTLTTKIRGNVVEQGKIIKLQIHKNRVGGDCGSVDVPFYNQVGIDDLGSMVDYLCMWKHWKKGKGDEESDSAPIKVPQWDVALPREELVAYIEAKGYETELKAEVAQCWNNVLAESTVVRKPKYGQGTTI